jgi:hypothetical protein
MLMMMAQPNRDWTIEILVGELRASEPLVADLLKRFQRTGLVLNDNADVWRWRPATQELEELSQSVARAHSVTPFAVVQTIVEAPGYQLREFSDAFRLRKD